MSDDKDEVKRGRGRGERSEKLDTHKWELLGSIQIHTFKLGSL